MTQATNASKSNRENQLDAWVDGFWQWSCHIYQNQDVAKLCLAVQDTLGLNVNYMLLALWTEQQRIAVDLERWKLIESEALSALEAVNYIRQKRVALKTQSEDAYQQALLIELKAEQQHQKQAIQALYKQYQLVNEEVIAGKNLENYLELHQIGELDRKTVHQLGQLVQNISS